MMTNTDFDPMRDAWFWVQFETLDAGYTAWMPALWKADTRKFFSVGFSGIPLESAIVGHPVGQHSNEQTSPIPKNWTISAQSDRVIIRRSDGTGCVAGRLEDQSNIASMVLSYLALDLLSNDQRNKGYTKEAELDQAAFQFGDEFVKARARIAHPIKFNQLALEAFTDSHDVYTQPYKFASEELDSFLLANPGLLPIEIKEKIAAGESFDFYVIADIR